jgi:hypothetical protein
MNTQKMKWFEMKTNQIIFQKVLLKRVKNVKKLLFNISAMHIILNIVKVMQVT